MSDEEKQSREKRQVPYKVRLSNGDEFVANAHNISVVKDWAMRKEGVTVSSRASVTEILDAVNNERYVDLTKDTRK